MYSACDWSDNNRRTVPVSNIIGNDEYRSSAALFRADNRVEIYYANLNPVITRSEVYSGVYGRASISLYAFNSNGNKGIACGLNNLQLIRPGEPLGGRASAKSDFATEPVDDFLE